MNVTLSLDDDLVKEVGRIAVERDTTVLESGPGVGRPYMPGLEFLDSDVLVYAYDPGDPKEQTVAQDLVRRAVLRISTQVLSEFSSTLLHKLSPPARPEDVIAVLDAPGPSNRPRKSAAARESGRRT
jgi:hypothetical protein